MKGWIGIVDCREDPSFNNDFLTLNLWGKSVYEYPLEEVMKCGFETCVVLTNSDFIKKNVESSFGNKVLVTDSFDFKQYENSKFLLVSGRAPLVKSSTLLKAMGNYTGGVHVYSSF